MTQEDKELLLKDICARLPYGVIVETTKGKGHVRDINLTIFGYEFGVNVNPTIRDTFSINDVKPYLFPMSSMTEEEKLMYEGLMIGTDNISYMLDVIDWLNAHHFDYRNLIDKGLAIDATGLNIYN